MDNIIPTFGVLAIRNDKVLLVKHGKEAGHISGTYGIPAGRKMEDESDKAAAARELNEETGLIAKEDDLLEYPDNIYEALIKRKDGTEKRFSVKVFICLSISGELSASGEAVPEWVNANEMENINFLPNVKTLIHDSMKFCSGKQ